MANLSQNILDEIRKLVTEVTHIGGDIASAECGAYEGVSVLATALAAEIADLKKEKEV